ncbi:transcriptional regulator [Lelliottia sp. AC1]|nr:transcriptional regulator [Lelliottia sp. AC1]
MAPRCHFDNAYCHIDHKTDSHSDYPLRVIFLKTNKYQ